MWGGKLVKVFRSEIPEYVDDCFWACADIWGRYRQFGLPFAGGWAEQPAHIIDAIEAIEKGMNAAER